MGKRKGNQGDSGFVRMSPYEFETLYSLRSGLPPELRLRVEREAKHRGMRNRRRSRKS